MTFIWIVVWLLSGTPQVFIHPINNWGVALGVCLLIDALNN